jgi:hypothetical protein
MTRKSCAQCLSLMITILLIFSFVSFSTDLSLADPGRGTWAPYTPKEQMIAQWKTLCDSHPNSASYEVIGETIQGREIWLFKIGNPSGAKVMYDCQAHGPEDGGTETLYKFCSWLLESDESLANHILENNYHLIIPILNMDTNARQNMRREYVLDNGTIIKVPYGVDLNRNSLYNWGHSGSSNPEDDYSYRGLYAGSEPETMAYHNAVAKYLPDIYVNTHIGSEVMFAYSNTAFEQEIVSFIAQYQQQNGVNYSYPIRFSGGGSGSIAADPDNNFGASGWLWELSTWENLKPTLVEWLNTYYPRAFPVFLAFAKAAENKQKTQTQQTPSISPPSTSSRNSAPRQSHIHDIAIINITHSWVFTNQSKIVKFQVKVVNNGDYTETFNLKLNANEIQIENRSVTIDPNISITLDFELRTIVLQPGNYTISAQVRPLPNESNTTNNLFELTSDQNLFLPEPSEDPHEIDHEIQDQNLIPIIIVFAIISSVTTMLLYKNKKRILGKRCQQ